MAKLKTWLDSTAPSALLRQEIAPGTYKVVSGFDPRKEAARRRRDRVRRGAGADSMREPGSIVSIGFPWKHSASGTVEWRLVDWTIEGDGWSKLPVLEDGSEDDPIAWGSDYAIRDRKTGEWHFPDGELADDETLKAAFAQRARAVQ